MTVVDTADAATDPGWSAATRRSLLRGGDSVVVRHVERLDRAALRHLVTDLRDAQAGDDPPWVAVTLGTGQPDGPEMRDLLQLFPTTLLVPPLRLRAEDVTALVPLLLGRLGRSGRLACSPTALRVLMRMPWPGNVAHLEQVLREVVAHRRTGVIEPADLPPEAHVTSRRVLTTVETLERDAIVHALADNHGNKTAAARSLGMSRATIYRKVRDYGIVA